MFILLLFVLMGAGFLHGRLRGLTDREAQSELVLVYLLAGYCGVVMIGVTLWAMINPSAGASMLNTDPGNPFQDFFMVAYLGMSVMAALSIWMRGSYLTASVICWSIYWFGATYLHLVAYHEAGALSLRLIVAILGAHTLVPIFMLILLALSGNRIRP